MAAFNNVSAITELNNNAQILNLDDCPPGCVDAINAINTRVNNLTTYINNALEGNANANIFTNMNNDGLGPMDLHEIDGGSNPNNDLTNNTGSTVQEWEHYNNSTLSGGRKRRKGRKTKKQKKTKKRGNKGKKLTKRNRK
jgi:hypothetical protein